MPLQPPKALPKLLQTLLLKPLLPLMPLHRPVNLPSQQLAK